MNKVMFGILGVIAVVILFFAGKYFVKKFLSPAPVSYQANTYYKKEDINKDGKVDALDEQLVIKQSGCQRNNVCWNKVIGKSISGDNPIYVSDLDLNGDGIVDLLDLQQIKTAE